MLLVSQLLTRGSRSSRMARGMYRVSSDWQRRASAVLHCALPSRPTKVAEADLVEEDVLSIPSFCRKVFEVAVLIDAMFLA